MAARPRHWWVAWLPVLLGLSFLLTVAVNASLGHPWEVLGDDPGQGLVLAGVLLLGALPWYGGFLLLARLGPLGRWLAPGPPRAGAAALATALTVAALGLYNDRGGFLSFTGRDLLVMIPGLMATTAADGLELKALLPDAARVDPRAWPGRRRRGERRSITRAELLPDGRVLLQVRVSLDRGIFPDADQAVLLALRADGALDLDFLERLAAAPAPGAPVVAGERLLFWSAPGGVDLRGLDGRPAPPEARDAFRHALGTLGATRLARVEAPGAVLAWLGERQGLLDVTGPTPRLLGEALPGADDGRFEALAAPGGGLLVPRRYGVLVGQPGEDPAALLATLLRRTVAGGGADPAFRFELPAELVASLGLRNVELRHLVAWGGRAWVYLYAQEEYLAALEPSGRVEAASLVTVRTEPGEGYGAGLTALEDGRLALAFSTSGGRTRLALLEPGRAGELPWLPCDEGTPGVQRRRTPLGEDLVLPGEALEVSPKGEVLLREGGALRRFDLGRGAYRDFAPPADLETPR